MRVKSSGFPTWKRFYSFIYKAENRRPLAEREPFEVGAQSSRRHGPSLRTPLGEPQDAGRERMVKGSDRVYTRGGLCRFRKKCLMCGYPPSLTKQEPEGTGLGGGAGHRARAPPAHLHGSLTMTRSAQSSHRAAWDPCGLEWPDDQRLFSY